LEHSNIKTFQIRYYCYRWENCARVVSLLPASPLHTNKHHTSTNTIQNKQTTTTLNQSINEKQNIQHNKQPKKKRTIVQSTGEQRALQHVERCAVDQMQRIDDVA
jgi:hypothetical protein